MKKPKPARKAAPGRKPKAWAPVPVAVQRKAHRIAVRTWKPVPVSVQRKRHQASVKAGHKPKVRKLSPGYDVACCAAQAVGTLLGLTDAEVLALYWETADGPDDGASIEDTLDAVGRFALGDELGVAADRVRLESERLGDVADFYWLVGAGSQGVGHVAEPGVDAAKADRVTQVWGHPLILGLELPEGPHAVLATGDGWWSWGDLYDPAEFPGAVIDEAWAVTL